MGAALDGVAALVASVSDEGASCGRADTSAIEDVISSAVVPLTAPLFGFTPNTSTGEEGEFVLPGLADNGVLSAPGFGLAGRGTEGKSESFLLEAGVFAWWSDWLSDRTYQHLR
jgi:hypothetical protein